MEITDEQKTIALTGAIAAAFLHFKWMVSGLKTGVIEPPTPDESKYAFQNDVTINRCTVALVSAVGAITAIRSQDKTD